MWLRYEAKGGSLLTIVGGVRVIVKPGAVFEASDEEAEQLLESGTSVVEVEGPGDAVEPEATGAAVVTVEPAEPEEGAATGPIKSTDLPEGGVKGGRKKE